MTTAQFLRTIGRDRTGDKLRIALRHQRLARQSTNPQSQGRRATQTTLLLIDPDDPPQLIARSVRGWDRLVSRLFASCLDRQLAEGHSPESSPFLAARAQVLVAPNTRRALARSWENLLAQARRPPTMRDPRVLCNREHILACERDIRQMLNALRSPLPSPARGTAMASWLLRDGTGPIYNGNASGDLSFTLKAAVAHLDPAVSLQDS